MAKKAANIKKVQGRNGKIRWEARAKIGRKDVQKTFDYLEDAQRWKREVEDAKSRKQSNHLDLKDTTFDQVFDFAEALKLKDYAKGNRNCIPRLREMLGPFRIKSLDQATLNKFVKELESMTYVKKHVLVEDPKTGKKVKEKVVVPFEPSTSRKYFFAFKLAVKAWAHHHTYGLGVDWDFKLPAAWGKPREVRVSDEDLEKLMKATRTLYRHGDDWKDAIMFFMNTALRTQELFYAEWRHIHDKTLFIPAENEKTSRSRYVPLNPTCREILERRAAKYGKEGYIFGNWPSIAAFEQQFKLYLRKNAGLPHIVKHDFRHEAICRMVERTTASHEQIMKMTGHTDMKTYLRYFTLRPQNAPTALTESILT